MGSALPRVCRRKEIEFGEKTPVLVAPEWLVPRELSTTPLRRIPCPNPSALIAETEAKPPKNTQEKYQRLHALPPPLQSPEVFSQWD